MSNNDQRKAELFKEALENYLFPIVHLLRDDSISEIMINGHDKIFVESKGKLRAAGCQFPKEEDLRAAVNSIAQFVGRTIDEQNPRLDARLPDGSRIHVVIPPCARNGTVVAIRKFSQVEVDFKRYIEWGGITPKGAQFLELAMYLGKNILVSGGTGSGKTTLLGLLCSRIPVGQRIIVIEDASELTLSLIHI